MCISVTLQEAKDKAAMGELDMELFVGLCLDQVLLDEVGEEIKYELISSLVKKGYKILFYSNDLSTYKLSKGNLFVLVGNVLNRFIFSVYEEGLYDQKNV